MLLGLEQMPSIGNRQKRQAKRAARKEKRAVKKTARQEKRADRKEQRQTKRATKKQDRVQKREARGGSRLKKVALAPARLAFLTAVRLNFLKIASKLATGYQRNPAAVKKFAAKFGYKWSNFAQAVSTGSKQQISGAEMGSFEAVLATALPIIIALPALFKVLNIGRDKETAALEAELTKQGADLNNPPEFYAGDPEPGAEYFDPATTGIDTNFLLLAAAGVAAIFVLPKFLK